MEEKTAKRALVFIGAGCGVLVLVTCCLSAGGLYYCKSSWDETEQVALTYLDTLRKGDVEAAYKQMTRGYRNTHDIAAFRAMLANNPPLTDHTAVKITQHFFQPDVVNLGGLLATPTGTVPFHVELENMHGRWSVADVGLSPATQPPH